MLKKRDSAFSGNGFTFFKKFEFQTSRGENRVQRSALYLDMFVVFVKESETAYLVCF